MEEYSRAKKINQYQNQVLSGEVDLSALRKKLEEEQIEKGEISIIVRYMSDQLMREDEKKATRAKGKNIFQGGILLTIGGLLFTLATYLGWIDMGNYFIVAYGPFLTGLILVFRGRNMMNN